MEPKSLQKKIEEILLKSKATTDAGKKNLAKRMSEMVKEHYSHLGKASTKGFTQEAITVAKAREDKDVKVGGHIVMTKNHSQASD